MGLRVSPFIIHITEASTRLYQWPWKCKCGYSDASFQLRFEHHPIHPAAGKPCLFPAFLGECLKMDSSKFLNCGINQISGGLKINLIYA